MGLLFWYASLSLLKDFLAANDVDALLHLAQTLACKVVDKAFAFNRSWHADCISLVEINKSDCDSRDASLRSCLIRQGNLGPVTFPSSSCFVDNHLVSKLLLPRLDVVGIGCCEDNLGDDIAFCD